MPLRGPPAGRSNPCSPGPRLALILAVKAKPLRGRAKSAQPCLKDQVPGLNGAGALGRLAAGQAENR